MRDRPTPVNRSIWTCRRSNDLIYAANLQMSRATGTVPERVQSRVHTTEPTRPVPEPFHCDHIARWSARSGTTERSGTGLNTGDWNGSGTVPVPNLWCEHGLRYTVEEHSGEISGFLVVNILKIQPFKVSVLYAVFALAIKMSTFEVSYLHYIQS